MVVSRSVLVHDITLDVPTNLTRHHVSVLYLYTVSVEVEENLSRTVRDRFKIVRTIFLSGPPIWNVSGIEKKSNKNGVRNGFSLTSFVGGNKSDGGYGFVSPCINNVLYNPVVRPKWITESRSSDGRTTQRVSGTV